MKFLTKLKIVHWVEKQLGLVYAPIPIYKEERTIQIARFQKIYRTDELYWMKNHKSLVLAMKQHLIFTLDSKAIKITEEERPEEGGVSVTAELKYVYP